MDDDLIDTAGELAGAALIMAGSAGVAATVVDYWQQKLEKERQQRKADKETDCPGCVR